MEVNYYIEARDCATEMTVYTTDPGIIDKRALFPIFHTTRGVMGGDDNNVIFGLISLINI